MKTKLPFTDVFFETELGITTIKKATTQQQPPAQFHLSSTYFVTVRFVRRGNFVFSQFAFSTTTPPPLLRERRAYAREGQGRARGG